MWSVWFLLNKAKTTERRYTMTYQSICILLNETLERIVGQELVYPAELICVVVNDAMKSKL